MGFNHSALLHKKDELQHRCTFSKELYGNSATYFTSEKEKSCLLLFKIKQELSTSILNRIAFRALDTKLSKQLQYMK